MRQHTDYNRFINILVFILGVHGVFGGGKHVTTEGVPMSDAGPHLLLLSFAPGSPG